MTERLPIVPSQLAPLLSEEVIAVHRHWQSVSLTEVEKTIPQPVETEFGQAIVLDPEQRNEDHTVVLGLPHQQAMKPSMLIRGLFLQQAVTPDARLVMLPNNSNGAQHYYTVSAEERQKISNGNLMSFYERNARLLEALGIKGIVDLTGYSLGALTANGVALALADSDKIQVGVINADEAPALMRTPKELQRDFLHSGTWNDQRRAIKDARIPALKAALNPARLAVDYARFALSAHIPENQALHEGMALQQFDLLVEAAASRNPDAFIKIGRIAGSRLFDSVLFEKMQLSLGLDEAGMGAQVEFVEYDGDGTHRHPTADNVVTHALMFKHAVTLAANT